MTGVTTSDLLDTTVGLWLGVWGQEGWSTHGCELSVSPEVTPGPWLSD